MGSDRRRWWAAWLYRPWVVTRVMGLGYGLAAWAYEADRPGFAVVPLAVGVALQRHIAYSWDAARKLAGRSVQRGEAVPPGGD